MKRLAALPAVALFATVLVAAGSPSYADPGNAFDVYAVQVPDLRVNSGACRSLPVELLHDGSGLEDAYANVEVWRGRTYVEAATLFTNSPGRISGSMLHCPSWEGLGKFRAGPSDVDYATTDFAMFGEFRDNTTVSFSILQDARASKFAAKRSGKRLTATGKATFYNVAARRWVSTPKGTKVKLQRQSPKGSWKSVKSGRVGAGGKINLKVRVSGKARYRLSVSGGQQTWSATSKAVRK